MYQIRKGWPSHAAIDEVFKADPALEVGAIKEGMIVFIKDGVGYLTKDDAGTAAFVIGRGGLPTFVSVQGEDTTGEGGTTVPGSASLKASSTFVGLMSQCVIECDAACFDNGELPETGAYVMSNDEGLFKEGTADNKLGKVIAVKDDGIVRILWHESM